MNASNVEFSIANGTFIISQKYMGAFIINKLAN